MLPLLAWISPAFPVGAFAYSHGLEWAAEAGDVIDEASLGFWLGDLLAHGAGRNDAILFGASHDAARAADPAALDEANALALALAPSGELRLETAQQGRSFLDAVLAAWPAPVLSELAAGRDEIAYPVAFGLAAAAHALPRRAAAEAVLFGFAQNLVSAAIRLGIVGQTGGSRVLAGLATPIRNIAADAEHLTPDDLGSSTFRADLGSFRHETQYTRLFRS